MKTTYSMVGVRSNHGVVISGSSDAEHIPRGPCMQDMILGGSRQGRAG
jgi:hypothetical protein